MWVNQVKKLATSWLNSALCHHCGRHKMRGMWASRCRWTFTIAAWTKVFTCEEPQTKLLICEHTYTCPALPLPLPWFGHSTADIPPDTWLTKLRFWLLQNPVWLDREHKALLGSNWIKLLISLCIKLGDDTLAWHLTLFSDMSYMLYKRSKLKIGKSIQRKGDVCCNLFPQE